MNVFIGMHRHVPRRSGASPARVKGILERIADAMAATAKTMRRYIKGHPGFAEVGRRMLAQWELGIASSLK